MPKLPVYSYDTVNERVVRQISLQLGYLLLQAGGTATIPPIAQVAAMLEEKWALELTRNPDGSCTLNLISVDNVPEVAAEMAKRRETPDARAN
jgi:hypothetical protein